MNYDLARAARFFALTLGWTWAAWGGAVVAGWSPHAGPGALLYAIGGAAPGAAALVLLFLTDTPPMRRDYLRRLLEVRRLGVRGAALALLVPPAAAVAAATAWSASGRGAVEATVPQGLGLLAILLLGPVPEEPGWRGYAFGPLQSARGTLAAALVLGVVWALWHLPLFAWPGTYQHALGLVSPRGAMFVAGLVVDSVFLAGLYNRTGGSTLGAIGYHFATNASGEIWELAEGAQLARLLFTAIGAALVVRGKGRTEWG